MKYLITLFLLFSFTSFAQIIITSSDLNAEYVPGTTSTIKTDEIVTTMDIGQLGATSWDFSSLTSDPGLDVISTAVDPATTPYAGNFPGANLGTRSIFVPQGDTIINYTYLSLNGSLDFHGVAAEYEYFDTAVTVTSTYTPPEISATLPYTFNSTVDYTGTRTAVTSFNGVVRDTLISTIVTHREVDAYGPMTMPGGQVYDALRVRIDEITINNFFPPPFNYDRHISYDFITKVGAFVNVPSDTTKPNVGVIANTASIAWAGPFVADVKIGETVPGDYELSQNYPNPFNPTTIIKFEVPELSFVSLKVYDVLGNEIETLINEEIPAGSYEIEYDASALTNGVYFYRLQAVPTGRQAGSFTETKKMVLLR